MGVGKSMKYEMMKALTLTTSAISKSTERKTITELSKVNQPYIRPTRKISRNKLCPCGSNLKYKKCCIGK